jgi:hypothetical protein
MPSELNRRALFAALAAFVLALAVAYALSSTGQASEVSGVPGAPAQPLDVASGVSGQTTLGEAGAGAQAQAAGQAQGRERQHLGAHHPIHAIYAIHPELHAAGVVAHADPAERAARAERPVRRLRLSHVRADFDHIQRFL